VSVTVLSPEQQVEAIFNEILVWLEEEYINCGQTNSLQTKLDGALAKLAGDDFSVAVNKLGAFINQVNALIESGQVPAEEGGALISMVQDVIYSIETEAEEAGQSAPTASPEVAGALLVEQPDLFHVLFQEEEDELGSMLRVEESPVSLDGSLEAVGPVVIYKQPEAIPAAVVEPVPELSTEWLAKPLGKGQLESQVKGR
jgi:hypothetical protein